MKKKKKDATHSIRFDCKTMYSITLLKCSLPEYLTSLHQLADRKAKQIDASIQLSLHFLTRNEVGLYSYGAFLAVG